MTAPVQSAALARQAEALVAALRDDDDAGAAEALAGLAAFDSAQLRARLARLADALHERVQALPAHAGGALNDGAEAVQSLDHVISLTESAAHGTLDLVEQGRALVDCLETSSDHVTACVELRRVFGELALAQGYQDLTGQILQRVRALIAGVEQSLYTLAGDRDGGTEATGPGVPGIDGRRSSQDEADDLLADLGL